jgi:hypothetical protein
MNQMTEAQGYLSKYLELSPTGQDAETAKALIEATKSSGPTQVQNPDASKTKTKQPAKTKE